jgi:acetyltransferase
VRIETLNQFFAAAKTLSTRHQPSGNRLAIVTNGNGPGLMAADRLIRNRAQLAEFSAQTTVKLYAVLPPAAKLTNPLDILGDAQPARFAAATSLVLEDDNVDGALVILTPLRQTQPIEQRAPSSISPTSRKPLLACWMGDTRFGRAAPPSWSALLERAHARGWRRCVFLHAEYGATSNCCANAGPSAVPEPACSIAPKRHSGRSRKAAKCSPKWESKALLARFTFPWSTRCLPVPANEAGQWRRKSASGGAEDLFAGH